MARPVFQLLQAEILVLSLTPSVSHIPYSIYKQSISVLSSKPIQIPIICHWLHYHHQGKPPLSLNSYFPVATHSPLLLWQPERALWNINQIRSLFCSKYSSGFPSHSDRKSKSSKQCIWLFPICPYLTSLQPHSPLWCSLYSIGYLLSFDFPPYPAFKHVAGICSPQSLQTCHLRLKYTYHRPSQSSFPHLQASIQVPRSQWGFNCSFSLFKIVPPTCYSLFQFYFFLYHLIIKKKDTACWHLLIFFLLARI